MTPRRVTHASLSGLEPLAEIATNEQHGMVDRLLIDFRAGSNAFSKQGESLWVVEISGQAIAVGGINVDPYYDDLALGRIRHLYVHPKFRRRGIGTDLMKAIEASGTQYFKSFQLFTANPDASRFYEALGYARIEGRWKVSHAKRAAA